MKFRITLTKTTRLRKVVEIEVTDEAACDILRDAYPGTVDLWAKQQALAAPGLWEDTRSPFGPTIEAKVEKLPEDRS